MNRGKERRAPTLSGHPRARYHRVAAWGVLLAVATATAILLVSVQAFMLFRHWSRALLLHTQQGFGTQASFEAVPNGSSPQSRPARAPMPSTSEVITAALKWQPPIADGKPSPFDTRAALPIVNGDHVLGSQHAPITLMLFGDFQCRYAMHALRTLVRRVEEQPSQYRLVWRERPLDIHPEVTAMAAEAENLAAQSGELAFWRFLHAISHLRGAATLATAKGIAQTLRRDTSSNEAKAAQRAAARLANDERVSAAYAIHASPTLFLNGFRIEGDINERELDEVIDEEFAEVRQLMREEVPQAKVYSVRVHANLLDLDSE